MAVSDSVLTSIDAESTSIEIEAFVNWFSIEGRGQVHGRNIRNNM